MKQFWLILATSLLLVGGLVLLSRLDRPAEELDGGGATTQPAGGPAATQPALRIAIVPERDIYRQRHRFEGLMAEVGRRIDRPVQLVTENTYDAVLRDFAEGEIDGAFLGSFVAVLAMDRFGARVLVKTESPSGRSDYRGVLFVSESSPIRTPEDLRGKTVGMVRTTSAAELFPMDEFGRLGLVPGRDVTPRWCGTHDEVVRLVMAGRLDAGAVKDLRLAALLAENPNWRCRELSHSEPCPENTLVLRADAPEEWRQRLRQTLLALDRDDRGRAALGAFGARRFLACEPGEFAPVYHMIDRLGAGWRALGVPGPPPGRAGAATQP